MKTGQEYRDLVKEGISEGRFSSSSEILDFLAKEVEKDLGTAIESGVLKTEEEVADAVLEYSTLPTDVFPYDAQFSAYASIVQRINVESLYEKVNQISIVPAYLENVEETPMSLAI